MTDNEITEIIIASAIEVHSILGPGLFESVYKECMAMELRERGLRVEKEQIVPAFYKGVKIDRGFRYDLLIEGRIMLELKVVSEISEINIQQTLTYLRLTDLRLGLVLNFNVTLMKFGIRRVINGYERPLSLK